jgi:ParB family transcriptional regulator, chromosome partitioning protein
MTITESMTAVLDIPITLLDPHPLNIRHSLGDLTDLVRSVKSVGVVEPLVVLPADESGRHRIIAGHRRHAAVTKAELPTVPCIVRPMDEAEVLEAMLAENGDGIRARITLVEEAEAYARLMTLRDGLSIKALAARVGRSQTYVRTRLVILALPAKALDRLHRGEMSLDVATALAKVADDAELIDALLTGERLDEWTIERAIKAREVERARAEREVDLIAPASES